MDMPFYRTRDTYYDTRELSLDTDDAAEVLKGMDNAALEELMFQLSLDLKSIEAQFYASRHRFFVGESKEGDKAWYAKMRSVQAIKVSQLMCAEHEFEKRVNQARIDFAAELAEIKGSIDTSTYHKRFYRVACQFLDTSAIDTINAFIVGRHWGRTNKAAHLTFLPNWDELKKANYDKA